MSRNGTGPSDVTPVAERVSPWAPLRHTVFTVMWLAAVVSNTGTWMYNTASGWMMTDLAPDPLIVSLVQVATSLPMFLLALPAGALADVIDRRRLLILVTRDRDAVDREEGRQRALACRAASRPGS